jgi:hypothetical protein
MSFLSRFRGSDVTKMSFPVGKTLYHGTNGKLLSGFPNRAGGNWFATDPRQAILHSMSRNNSDDRMYLYIYKVINPPTVLRFNSIQNFNKFAKRQGSVIKRKSPNTYNNQDVQVAQKLCQKGVYDGWWFPLDQTQVMLCRPSSFLRFVKVLRVSAHSLYFPRFMKGMWKGTNHLKYSTEPISLNNVINRNQPDKNSIYAVYNRQNKSRTWFNVNGNPINVAQNGVSGYRYKNGTYGYSIILEGSQRNIMRKRLGLSPNDNRTVVMSERVRPKGYFFRKTNNNTTNLNASSLYG